MSRKEHAGSINQSSQYKYTLRYFIHVYNLLHPEIPDLLPPWPGSLLGTLSIHLSTESVEVNFATALIDVDLRELDAQGPLAVVELISNEKHDDDGASEVGFEECFCVG